MLKILRKRMKAILIATIIVIIPAFIFFYGAGRYRGKGGRATVIAKVNGQSISYPRFYDVYQMIKERRQAVYGAQWDDVTEKQTRIEALEQLIRETLLRQEARRRRIKVSDEEVLRAIQSNPYFQKEGKFNKEFYLRIMKISRVNPKDYEEGVRSDLRTSKLLRQVVGGVTVSDEELKREYTIRNEKVRVKYLLFKAEDFKKDVTVNEQEIEKYFQAHREEFKIPDRVNVDYIMIKFKPEEIKVKEEEIKSYYQEHLDQFKKKKQGEGETVSKESSPVPLKDVKEEIRASLTNRKAEERAREEAEDLANNLFDRDAWENLVKDKDLKVKETGFFARGEAIEGIGWAPDFVKEAFSLGEDDVSGVVLTPKGYAIFIVKEKSEAHLPQLNEVKDKVEEKLRYEKARELARAKVEECLSKLSGGNSFEEVAKDFSLTVKDSDLFSRGEYIKGIGFSPSFAKAAFSLQKGEISPVVEVRQGFAILKMEAKQGISEDKYASEAADFHKKFLSWKQMEVYKRWYRTLRENADIWVDPDFQEKTGWTPKG